MLPKLSSERVVWLLIGVAVGVSVALFFPGQPVQATATDHAEEFAIATGLVQRDLEAVYLLDFTTGRLLGTVLNTQTGKFQPFSTRELTNDFRLNPRSKPNFVMVTGLMTSARSQIPINHMLYVAELRSGRMAAYYIPYLGATAAGTASRQLQMVDMIAFRQR